MAPAAATGGRELADEIRGRLDGRELSREELDGARLATSPGPQRLDRPLTDLHGVGAKIAAAAARIGLRTLGDLIEHYPHDYGDRSSADRDRRAPAGRAGDGRRRGPDGPPAADPAPEPHDRRGDRRRRLRPDERHLVQPGVARRSAQAGRPDAAQRPARSQRLPARRLRDPRRGGDRRRGRRPDPRPAGAAGRASTRPGIVPIHPSGEGLRTQKIREWVWVGAPAGRRTRSSRCRPRCAARRGLPGRRRRPDRDPLPALDREAAARRPPPARLRGALPPPGRAPDPPRRAPRTRSTATPPRRAGRTGRGLGRAAFRSSRPPTSSPRSTRSTPTSARAGRCSGC